MWESNPRIPEPQSGVLTTSPISPCANTFYQQNVKKATITIKIKNSIV